MKPPKKPAAETRREVLQLLQTEGLLAAAEAAIAVCRDPNAPPNARATASGLIMRATSLGGFGKSNENDDVQKAPHEMSLEEIYAKLASLRAEAADRAQDRQEDDVYEDEGAGSAFD